MFMKFPSKIAFSLFTSNVTDRHRGPKRKLRAGYRAPLRHRSAMCAVSHSFAYWTSLTGTHVIFFIFECGIVRIILTSRLYPYAKFRLCGHLRCWASPRSKIAYSINQWLSLSVSHSLSLTDAPGTEAFTSELQIDKSKRISQREEMHIPIIPMQCGIGASRHWEPAGQSDDVILQLYPGLQ